MKRAVFLPAPSPANRPTTDFRAVMCHVRAADARDYATRPDECALKKVARHDLQPSLLTKAGQKARASFFHPRRCPEPSCSAMQYRLNAMAPQRAGLAPSSPLPSGADRLRPVPLRFKDI